MDGMTEKKDRWTLHTDGAARGNPGPAGAGAVLRRPDGTPVAEVSRNLGTATNNEAEYMGLLEGLEAALAHGALNLSIRMDSELIVRQLAGQYKVRNERLRPLYDRALAMLHRLEAYDIVHVRRELNAEADALAARAADESRM
jgi:ribonuclease HI